MPASPSGRPWVLTDYGGVLALYQSDQDSRAMAEIAGTEWQEFHARYWELRPAYDAGDVTASDYWSRVVSGEPDSSRLERLIAKDVESWSRPNWAALEVFRRVPESSATALLSNAPVELAEVIPHLPWIPRIDAQIYSCDLHLVKPDPRIFRLVADRLATPLERILLIDDRKENIVGALEVGMQAHQYSTPSALVAALEGFGIDLESGIEASTG